MKHEISAALDEKFRPAISNTTLFGHATSEELLFSQLVQKYSFTLSIFNFQQVSS